MSQTRSVGQELQEQILATARKGRQRVQATVRTVTATAQAIQPQLPNLPKPQVILHKVPRPTQIREAAPGLLAKVPSSDQFKAGVSELADQLKAAQDKVASRVAQSKVPDRLSSQVRHAAAAANLAAPLAKQAVAEFRHAATAATPLAKQAVAEFRHAASAARPLVLQAATAFSKTTSAVGTSETAGGQPETPDATAPADAKTDAKTDASAGGAAASDAKPTRATRKPRPKSDGR